MKAVVCTRYGPPEVLALREAETPLPRSDQVRIRIIASGVTASDCLVRGFAVKPSLRVPMGIALGFGKPRRPILGMVFSGEVESIGSKVASHHVGDPVFGCDFHQLRFGMYAEYVCLPTDGLLAPKPANLTHLEAAALPYGGLLALHFLQLGDVGPGKQVLIYGASGAIGTAAVQLAKNKGARVTGVCGPTNVDLVRSLGAERVIDYTREDFAESGEQYDFILNAVGKAKAQLHPAHSLAPNGRHVTVDDGRPKVEVEQLLELKELAERGAIRPVIDRCYPLEAIVEAHRYVEAGHKKGNVAIAIGPT